MRRERGGREEEERERKTWKREGREINRTERVVDEWEGERDG